MPSDYAFFPYGDGALIVETAEEISEAAYIRIRGLKDALEADRPDALLELIPAYRSLLVVYDPLKSDYPSLEARVKSCAAHVSFAGSMRKEIVRIPVCYEGEYAPDLEDVARHARLSAGEVVDIHASGTYLVYMLGFTPGFPYLGGMSDRIAAPRRSSPRTKIPAGSVGIADRQTGIYPVESPGGWNIIGRTPARLFDPGRDNPVLLRAGQHIRFFPVTSGEYQGISEAVQAGAWKPEIFEEAAE